MKKKTKNKKITMDVLAGMISAGTKETKSFVGEEIEGLAGMVQRGFTEATNNLSRVENNLRILSENNTRDHEDIKLRLDNACPVR